MISAQSRIIIKRMPFWWLLGVLLPLLYVLFIKNLKKPVYLLVKKEPYSILIGILFVIQIISVLLAIPQEYFSLDRLVAILHNIAAFSFLLLGFSFAYFQDSRFVVNGTFKNLFLFLSLSCITVFLFSKVTHIYVEYPGILRFLTGITNDFTNVIINQQGWFAGMEFPRSRVMGLFPNSTGLLLMIVFVLLFVTTTLSVKERVIYGSLFVLATVTTGSRNLILFSVVIFLSQFVQSKRNLIFLIFFVPVFLIAGLVAIEYLSGLRKDSNATRFLLYWESIQYSMSYNPLFGLGLKPKVPEIAGGELPIGSHSTVLGYFVKNGIIGGLFALYLYLHVVLKALIRIVMNILQKTSFNQQRFTLSLGIILIMLSLLFDDLDSYEVAPFFLGYLLYIFKSNGLSEVH